MERILGKFDVGKIEHTNFRFCGRRFRQNPDFSVDIDVEDNTRLIKHIDVDKSRKATEKATEREVTSLRSVVGSLAWVARYARPDLCYRVNCLQRACSRATVGDLRDANRVVDLAKADIDVKLHYEAGVCCWDNVSLVSFSDASFAQEEGFRSQQGRLHYLCDASEVDTNEHHAHIISYASTTIKRVCRSTLQAETYGMQSAVEAGDRLRAIICEVKGLIPDMKEWFEASQRNMMWVTDCRSLSDHLNAGQAAKVSDKRLGIELAAMRNQLWHGDVMTCELYAPNGDRLRWTDTATQLADALTKSMKPHQLFRTMREGVVTFSEPNKKLPKTMPKPSISREDDQAGES